MDFRGKHFTAADVTFTQTPAQRPRPPAWIGCNWPDRLSLRRAAQWADVAPHAINPRRRGPAGVTSRRIRESRSDTFHLSAESAWMTVDHSGEERT